MRNEDYGRISRILADGADVTLEFDVVNRVYPEGKTSYNTVAEIPGTDKADEIVMLGAHFDSWHSGTGATDNAAGSAVMLEAVRRICAERGVPAQLAMEAGCALAPESIGILAWWQFSSITFRRCRANIAPASTSSERRSRIARIARIKVVYFA